MSREQKILLVLTVLLAGVWAWACTVQVDVPQPVVNIGCTVVNLPGGDRLEACDGGPVTVTGPRDAGKDGDR